MPNNAPNQNIGPGGGFAEQTSSTLEERQARRAEELARRTLAATVSGGGEQGFIPFYREPREQTRPEGFWQPADKEETEEARNNLDLGEDLREQNPEMLRCQDNEANARVVENHNVITNRTTQETSYKVGKNMRERVGRERESNENQDSAEERRKNLLVERDIAKEVDKLKESLKASPTVFRTIGKNNLRLPAEEEEGYLDPNAENYPVDVINYINALDDDDKPADGVYLFDLQHNGKYIPVVIKDRRARTTNIEDLGNEFGDVKEETNENGQAFYSPKASKDKTEALSNIRKIYFDVNAIEEVGGTQEVFAKEIEGLIDAQIEAGRTPDEIRATIGQAIDHFLADDIRTGRVTADTIEDIATELVDEAGINHEDVNIDRAFIRERFRRLDVRYGEEKISGQMSVRLANQSRLASLMISRRIANGASPEEARQAVLFEDESLANALNLIRAEEGTLGLEADEIRMTRTEIATSVFTMEPDIDRLLVLMEEPRAQEIIDQRAVFEFFMTQIRYDDSEPLAALERITAIDNLREREIFGLDEMYEDDESVNMNAQYENMKKQIKIEIARAVSRNGGTMDSEYGAELWAYAEDSDILEDANTLQEIYFDGEEGITEFMQEFNAFRMRDDLEAALRDPDTPITIPAAQQQLESAVAEGIIDENQANLIQEYLGIGTYVEYKLDDHTFMETANDYVTQTEDYINGLNISEPMKEQLKKEAKVVAGVGKMAYNRKDAWWRKTRDWLIDAYVNDQGQFEFTTALGVGLVISAGLVATSGVGLPVAISFFTSSAATKIFMVLQRDNYEQNAVKFTQDTGELVRKSETVRALFNAISNIHAIEGAGDDRLSAEQIVAIQKSHGINPEAIKKSGLDNLLDLVQYARNGSLSNTRLGLTPTLT